MKKIILSSYIILLSLPLFSQSLERVKLSLYFEVNEFDLNGNDLQLIDDTIDTLFNYTISKVVVSGNTDNTGDSLKNLALSAKRAHAVSDYLIGKGINKKIISIRFFGQDKPVVSNETDEGKQKNRRTEVLFFLDRKKETIGGNTIQDKIAEIDTCKRDTTIILAQGTELIFNICEYLEMRDCLEFIEANNSDDILINGLSLMDEDGIPIASCGMLRISLLPGCTEKSCFDHPVKVRFPVPENKECDYCGKNAAVWDVNSDGTWREAMNKREKIKIVRVNGRSFYQFNMICPNFWKNCDCQTDGNKLKIKVKRGYEIVSVNILFDCPTAVLKLTPKGKKHVAVTRVPCWGGEKTVLATIISPNGDTLYLPEQPLDNLQKRLLFSRCGKSSHEKAGYWIGIFPIKTRYLFRKYIIKPELLR